ncbi:MAG: TolC family outer membrane protein [Thiohalomonadales bacterium]
MKIHSFFVLALLLFSSPSFAETVLDIYNLALVNDPEYLAAIEIENATEEELSIALANYLPTVTLSANGSQSDSTSDTTLPPAPSADPPRLTETTVTRSTKPKSTGYGAQLSLPLYNYTNFVLSDIADASVLQAQANLVTARHKLIIKVAVRYFTVLAGEDGVGFAKAELESIARQLDQTKQRFDVGLVAITDVHEAQARYDLSLATGIQAENDLANARESLREVTGRYHDNLAHLLEDTPLLEPKPANIDKWTDLAIKQSFIIRSVAQGITIAKENINFARAGYYPRLNLTVNYDANVNESDSIFIKKSDSTGTSANLNLSYSLYEGGATRSRVRQAGFQLSQAKQNLEQARRSVQRTARESYMNVIAGISRVKALKQAVISRESAQSATEAGFEVGTKTTVDVLISRRELFFSQNSHAQARYTLVIDNLKLRQAAGDVSAQDLEQITNWLK